MTKTPLSHNEVKSQQTKNLNLKSKTENVKREKKLINAYDQLINNIIINTMYLCNYVCLTPTLSYKLGTNSVQIRYK